jgi:hypothetical protein
VGRKQYIGHLTDHNGIARFKITDKGFGFFGRGLDYYAPTSVLALCRFFAQKQRQSPYLFSLRQMCRLIGNVAKGSMRISNPTEVGNQILVEAITITRSLLNDKS